MARQNPVAEAIRRLGGMTPAVLASQIPQPTWVRYRRIGRIADPARVFQVADLTGMDPRVLAGLPAADDEPEPPASPGPAASTAKGKVRSLPKRRARSDEPRVYGTIRPPRRNNWPLFVPLLAA